MPYAPDLLLVNANVRTMDPARPRAAAVAVTGGRIAGVGDDAAEAAGGAAAGNVIDLKGATLIPGFHDAHNHMAGFGLSLTEVDLRVDNLDELYARVAARAAAPPGDGSPARATTRPRPGRTRTATPSTGSRPLTGSSSSTPPVTCAW